MNGRQLDLVSKLKALKHSCQLWNQRVFVNIFHRKFRCLARLRGVQQALQSRPSRRLELLEESLCIELEAILEQEETFWHKKSRVSWLKNGERNTNFFHRSALIRCRRNYIARLKVNGGVWCEDQGILRKIARDFYIQLYSSEPCLPTALSEWLFSRVCHQQQTYFSPRSVCRSIENGCQ